MEIRLYSNVVVNLLDLKPEDINIEDIAHGLSKICRFGAQIPCFYSVAEHSINISHCFTDPKSILCGLLHDASEAYLGSDEPSPKKTYLYVKIGDKFITYNELEQKIIDTVMIRYNLYEHYWSIKPQIKAYDKNVYYHEKFIVRDSEFINARNANTLYFYNTREKFLEIFNKRLSEAKELYGI